MNWNYYLKTVRVLELKYKSKPMFKDFIMKKMLDRQLKNVPEDQKEKIMRLITEKPELFQKIAMEAQVKMKQGKSQMDAMMEVAKEHQDELKGIL